MIKRILLALGGTPFSHAAVRTGIDLARSHTAELTAVTILDTASWAAAIDPTTTAAAAARLAEAHPPDAAKRRLDRVVGEFRRACREADIEPHVIRPDHQPLRELVEAWRCHDLLLFGLRGLFDYTLVPQPEQTIADLIRQGVSPILAVARRHRAVKRVMIAYSGSIESANAMKRYAQSSLWPDASIHIACFGREPDEARRLLAEAEAYFAAHGRATNIEPVSGSPAAALLPYAHRLKVDLIVLGDSHRTTLMRQVMGDTTSHIVREADRPLFISH